MDKKICGILFTHKKEGYPAIRNNRDRPWVHHAKWDKTDGESQVLYNNTCVKCKKVKLIKDSKMMVTRE